MFNDDNSRNPSSLDGINRLVASVQSNGPYDSADLRLSANPYATTDEAATGYATYEFRRVLAQIDQASDEQSLFWIANTAFGPNSFYSRFGEAISKAPHHMPHLPLQKQVMQAELNDHLSGRTDWPPSKNRSLGFGGPELWEVGHLLRHARINLLCDQGSLKKAAETRDALLSELNTLFNQPTSAFLEIRAGLDPQTRSHWLRYVEKVKTAKSKAEAGWSLGIVLADVLGAIALIGKRGEIFPEISEAAPTLTAFAIALKQ